MRTKISLQIYCVSSIQDEYDYLATIFMRSVLLIHLPWFLDFSMFKIFLSSFSYVQPYLSVSLFSVASAPHCSVLLGKIMYPAVEDRTWIDVAICKTISSKVDDFYGIFFH